MLLEIASALSSLSSLIKDSDFWLKKDDDAARALYAIYLSLDEFVDSGDTFMYLMRNRENNLEIYHAAHDMQNKCSYLIDSLRAQPIAKAAEIYVPDLKILIHSVRGRMARTFIVLKEVVSNENITPMESSWYDQAPVSKHVHMTAEYLAQHGEPQIMGLHNDEIEFERLLELNRSILNQIRLFISTKFDISQLL